MANEPQVLEGGLFINPDGKLVHEAPEAGIQIVAPGGTLDDNAKGRLKAEFDIDASAVDALVAGSSSSSTSSDDDASDDGLDKLNKADLEQLATDNDVDLSDAKNNGDRVDALRAAGVSASQGE